MRESSGIGDIASFAFTDSEVPAWLRVYFQSPSNIGGDRERPMMLHVSTLCIKERSEVKTVCF